MTLSTSKTLSFVVNPQVTQTGALLEDFATRRTNSEGTGLFDVYLGEDPNQTASLDPANMLKVVVGASSGIYMHFMPYNFGYSFPNGYAQHYIKSGLWNINYNRLRFWVKTNKTIARRSDGGSQLEIGTYVKTHSNSDNGYQGQHYYHILDPNFYANQWHYFELNRVPQHRVGNDPNANYPENPESGVNYYDGLTRFYFDSQGSFSNSTWFFDDFTFNYAPNEPDTLVSSICAVYSGTKYEVTWATPKNQNVTYDIYTSNSSMKTNGLSSGILRGTAVSTQNSYTGTIWSWITNQVPTLYIAIKPRTSSTFTEIQFAQRS